MGFTALWIKSTAYVLVDYIMMQFYTNGPRIPMAFERLERCEAKVSRTVLRGLGAGNSPRLPDPFSATKTGGFKRNILGQIFLS
jgi:hypothetical protein